MEVCKCGCVDFHTFMTYKSIGIKRIRCLACDRTYEIKNGEMKEIDLKKIWQEEINKIRR